MRISTLKYSMKQGMKSMKSNQMFSLASIGTITACLFLFGIFYFVVANFQYMIKTAETSVGVTVFFDQGISEDEIKAINKEVAEQSKVSSTVYISAEETWENYKEKYLSKELAETFGTDNPLSDSASLEVYLDEVSSQEEVVKFIQNIDGVRQVNYSDSIANTFNQMNTLVGYVSLAIIVILLAVAVFLISTTVTMGISVRKDEIFIMKLIGATDNFIRAPFIVEGIMIGFLGAFIPLLGLYFIYNKVITYITEKYINVFRSFQFLESGEIFKILIPTSILIGIGIGFLGSAMTVKRHLRKKES